MVCKTDKIKVGDKEVVITQLSFINKLRYRDIVAEKEGKVSIIDLIKVSISDEDFKLLENSTDKEVNEGDLYKKMCDLNEWNNGEKNF